MNGSRRYEIWSGAADGLRTHGWIRGSYRNAKGGMCLVGSVLEAGGPDSLERSWHGWLSLELAEELDAHLKRRPGYCACRIFSWALLGGDSRWRQAAVQSWNDVPWRRKVTVVGVLDALAKKYEGAHLQSEIRALEAKVSYLEEAVASLRERVLLLEAENGRLWRRVLGIRQLEEDRDQLLELEGSLSEAWANLNQATAKAEG